MKQSGAKKETFYIYLSVKKAAETNLLLFIPLYTLYHLHKSLTEKKNLFSFFLSSRGDFCASFVRFGGGGEEGRGKMWSKDKSKKSK